MVVAHDWTEHRLGDVIKRAFSGPSPTCEERNVRGEEWGVLKTTCSTADAGWDPTKHKVLPIELWGMSHLEVRPGDSIITKAGPRHRVAVPAFVSHVRPRIIPSGKMICLRPDPTKIEPGFLALALADRRTQSYLDQRTTGMAESQVNYENADLLSAPLWLPSLEDQRRIMGPLDEAHSLIAALERMIAKKQAIKQGMMQQLLTGKTRLPGFTEPWGVRKVGDLLAYEQPSRYLVSSTDYGNTGTPVLTAGKTFLLGYTPDRHGAYRDVPVIIFDDFTTASKYVDFPFKAKSSAMKMLSARSGVNLRYIYERMQLIDFVAVDHKRRWIAEYSRIEIDVPELAEQDAIAGVLSDADQEIRLLESRLTKAQDIKTGMMQELLTGRTRLPVAEGAA